MWQTTRHPQSVAMFLCQLKNLKISPSECTYMENSMDGSLKILTRKKNFEKSNQKNNHPGKYTHTTYTCMLLHLSGTCHIFWLVLSKGGFFLVSYQKIKITCTYHMFAYRCYRRRLVGLSPVTKNTVERVQCSFWITANSDKNGRKVKNKRKNKLQSKRYN